MQTENSFACTVFVEAFCRCRNKFTIIFYLIDLLKVDCMFQTQSPFIAGIVKKLRQEGDR